MKNLIQYISIGFFCLVAFACSNNFLSEVPEGSFLTTTSEILISPEWEAADYSVYVPMAGYSYFDILQTPVWLTVQSRTGQFTNNQTTINCRASKHSDFPGTGIYKSSIVLYIEGQGKITIPVAYITEGNPAIETENTVILPYTGYFGSFPLTIKNRGEGILLWTIVEKPEWIAINDLFSVTNPPRYSSSFAISSFNEFNFMLSYDFESLNPNDLTGKRIVIASNDKNKSQTVIDIQFDMGNPVMFCDPDILDFETTDFTRLFNIYNQGDGLLTWRIESCPEWLSVSETSGILTPSSSKTLQFTCNRDLLPYEQLFQTIYLVTNDENDPWHAITVLVDNSYYYPGDTEDTEDTEDQ